MATVVGHPIALVNWEGSANGTIAAGINTNTHLISTTIPANKMVVISLSNISADNADNMRIKLYNSNTLVNDSSGGWFTLSRMNYFKTTSSSNQYKVHVETISSTPAKSYTINVSIVNIIQPFVAADTAGYAQSASTYLLSNSPEGLNDNYHKGEWGFYLVRGTLNSRCRAYWEHYNQWTINMSFGVLLWNRDTVPVVVSLTSRSSKTVSGSGTMENALTGVWVDTFNDVKQADQSELPTSGSVTIPAYNASNPSASTLWVARSSVPPGLFNGVLSMEIKNTNGTLYTNSKVFFDTYIMTPGYENQIKPNIATMALAQVSDPLRGSGTGAALYTTISSTISITSSDPYNILITGFDTPMLQTGEKISLTTYKQNFSTDVINNGMNYAVRYAFVFNGFSSSSTIKGKVKFNRRTNPNAAFDPDGGIYVVGYILGQTVFSKLITNSSPEFIFNSNIPQNQQVVLNVVVSGMSSLPLEISFFN